MSVDLTALTTAPRLLFSIPLRPIQGHRFQPTGFPSLGAATFETRHGTSLLVESAQSMANRLELTLWDEAAQKPIPTVAGISHIMVTRGGTFYTDTLLEAHRINSPYLLSGSNKSFSNDLKKDLGNLGEGPIDRRKLADVLLKYDINSLLHGVFLAKKDLAGGRLRVARALTAFVEADGVRIAASGGVKNDHVNPKGSTKDGFGNVPFARNEYTAEAITLYLNLDLALLRGYGLGSTAEHLLTLLALYKIARLLSSGLRLRTACDLEYAGDGPVLAQRPSGFVLPDEDTLAQALPAAIAALSGKMLASTYSYDDEIRTDTDTDES